ncbi:MAG: glycosyltransferase [Gammaproteobacteria bacterium]|nr:glycosyltransferase [Gammaproteobacteria bacterium]
MGSTATNDRDARRTDAETAFVVLGMHRSGTSAVTGALGLCGAWVGEESELTSANPENPRGFWERRDIRRICDRLLHAAEADWWKVAAFDPASIPPAVLTEQREEFCRVVSALGKHDAWVVKEPRLCLLLPVLRDCIANPFCIHIFRNPLEVARSLQARNGFGIAGGLALWEAYNRHALSAARDLPRVFVSHESLMLHPVETLHGLLERLLELGATSLTQPDGDDLRQFVSSSLYRYRATEQEMQEYLAPTQRDLWQQLRDNEIGGLRWSVPDSPVTQQYLFDLESTEASLNRYRDTADHLSAELRRRDRSIGERDAAVRERDATIRSRDATIRSRDATIRRMEDRADALRSELKTRDATIESNGRTIRRLERRTDELNSEVRALLASTSWRVTAPLRALSLGIRWTCKSLADALLLLFWICTGRFSRARDTMRSIVGRTTRAARPGRDARRDTSANQVSRLIAECRKDNEQAATGTVANGAGTKEPGTKVSVVAWDLAHNPLGRAYLLADALRNEYDVELIGATFPRFGDELWEPLRTGSRVTIKRFPGRNFPEHFKIMRDVAEQVDGDIIVVSKPRLPSLELAILAKLHRNRPIVLDIDDYELGFFENRQPLTLQEIKANRRTLDTDCPHDEVWTRYGESLIPLFDRITVSNEELQRKYGGMVLPHVRDAHDFDPALYPRDEIRAALGFGPEDRVIVFAGTPRVHKGYERTVAALEKLNCGTYKFLLIGSPSDRASRRFIEKLKNENVTTVPNVPFRELPGYLSAGDLICLLQDEGNVTSRYQMPAKFTDGLAMGIPMLATRVPPLVNLANAGLVELLDDTPLERRIDQIFTNYEAHKNAAVRNRQAFVQRFSYDAVVPRLKDLIDPLLGCPAPVPDEFRELISHHREVYSNVPALPRLTPEVVADGECLRREGPVNSGAPAAERRRKDRRYVDDNWDIVFFWKQNDSGIYGRRQDMLVKYLAMEPRIQRIFHFDAPINLLRSGGVAARTGVKGDHSHARLVLLNTLRRRYFRRRWTKVRRDTFTYLAGGRAPRLVKRLLSCEDDYLDYLDRVLERHHVGERRVIFWVCPNNFHFPSIARRFQPDLIVSDVIDDQRKWKIPSEYEERLHRNYRDILGRSDLVFVNCHSVLRSMREFSDNIHLLPNAAEILETEARSGEKPQELRGMSGPVIGYVGNLDAARIDIELLERVASERPGWNLVFIGSMHRGKQIRTLSKFRNVHFLGVRVHDKALQYIRHFDVAIIPHLDNALTRNMNPLKLYVYFSLHIPVVATPIANIDDFSELTRVGHTPKEFVDQIEHCLERNPLCERRDQVSDMIARNSWHERVRQVLELLDAEFRKRSGREKSTDGRVSSGGNGTGHDPADGYMGQCAVCGHSGRFLWTPSIESIRENYHCPACKATLRYREQARLVVKHFAREGSDHLAALAREADFRALKIYEPGLIGPFRRILGRLPCYRTSFLWPDVPRGEYRRGIQCQDLMDLTYGNDHFDLVLSSDIFEHVRKPFEGFREVNRVLKPGGFHIFSIPVAYPLPCETVFRVDTSGDEDVFVLPAHYHGAPFGGKSLVYTDFGADMAKTMEGDGIDLRMEGREPSCGPAGQEGRVLTFYWKKQG